MSDLPEMRWSGCSSPSRFFYCFILTNTLYALHVAPHLLHVPLHITSLHSSNSPLHAAPHRSYPLLHDDPQDSESSYTTPIQPSYSPLHIASQTTHSLLNSGPRTSLITSQKQNLPPKPTSYALRYTLHLHNRLGAIRSKRQSSIPHLIYPAAPKGAAPPSQYPWAIVWDPTVSDEEWGLLGSAPFTSRPAFHQERDLVENEMVRGLDLRGAPATLRPQLYPPIDKDTDPQLYVTIVISLIIVIVAAGIIIKFCCDRRHRRRHRTERCPLPEEGSLQPLTDLSPDSETSCNPPGTLGADKKGAPTRTGKIPVDIV